MNERGAFLRRFINVLSVFIILAIGGGVGYWVATVPQPARVDAQITYLRDFIVYRYQILMATPEDDVAQVLADKGNAYSQLRVAEKLFGQGAADTAMYDRAVTYLKAGAERGIPAAQNALGAAYRHGTGVARDPVAAYQWYKLAADRNDTLARRNLFDVSTDLGTAQVESAIVAAQNWLGAYEAKPFKLDLLP